MLLKASGHATQGFRSPITVIGEWAAAVVSSDKHQGHNNVIG